MKGVKTEIKLQFFYSITHIGLYRPAGGVYQAL
jgi:hypothetical protein